MTSGSQEIIMCLRLFVIGNTGLLQQSVVWDCNVRCQRKAHDPFDDHIRMQPSDQNVHPHCDHDAPADQIDE